MQGSNFGRVVFGTAAFSFGIVTLLWPDYYNWLELRHIWNAQDGRLLAYGASGAQIVGGVAIQFRRSAKMGAIVLGATYLVFALLCVPRIIAKPQIYDRWGNFFEQFSLATGAAIAYARLSSESAPKILNTIGRNLLGLCAISFALEQAFYLTPTATLVPKWLPPSQMFWAVVTTLAFALAAVALVTNRMALLAARLLTAMILGFGLIVWIPLLLTDPANYPNWSETVETFAIAGVAWIVADVLSE